MNFGGKGPSWDTHYKFAASSELLSGYAAKAGERDMVKLYDPSGEHLA